MFGRDARSYCPEIYYFIFALVYCKFFKSVDGLLIGGSMLLRPGLSNGGKFLLEFEFLDRDCSFWASYSPKLLRADGLGADTP